MNWLRLYSNIEEVNLDSKLEEEMGSYQPNSVNQKDLGDTARP